MPYIMIVIYLLIKLTFWYLFKVKSYLKIVLYSIIDILYISLLIFLVDEYSTIFDGYEVWFWIVILLLIFLYYILKYIILKKLKEELYDSYLIFEFMSLFLAWILTIVPSNFFGYMNY